MRTMFSKLEKERGWNWRARIAANHNWPPKSPASAEENEADYENLLNLAQLSANDVLNDIRYLKSFCEFVVMGGPRLEQDLREVLSTIKQLPGWKKQYQAALAWKSRHDQG